MHNPTSSGPRGPIFTPAADEIAYWQDLVRLAAEAEERGTGPILYGDPKQGEQAFSS